MPCESCNVQFTVFRRKKSCTECRWVGGRCFCVLFFENNFWNGLCLFVRWFNQVHCTIDTNDAKSWMSGISFPTVNLWCVNLIFLFLSPLLRRRLYCNQCLIKRKDKILCDRCVVFTTRPISKIDLLKLKPKDLIFYLQSKHISTTGCVGRFSFWNRRHDSMHFRFEIVSFLRFCCRKRGAGQFGADSCQFHCGHK